MKIVINRTGRICLTVLKVAGYWRPETFTGFSRLLYNIHTICFFMSITGAYIITHGVDLCMCWGNLPLMTVPAFLLLTYLAQAFKIANIVARRERIRKIINSADEVLAAETSGEGREIVARFDRENLFLLVLYISIAFCTLTGWAIRGGEGELPIRAWYPYDTSKSPAFELTYFHQAGGLYVLALLNISKDTLVMIAQCRCRLQLLGLKLRTLCSDLETIEKRILSKEQEAIALQRLKECVKEHQAILEAARELQICFSGATFFQFFVSRIIICVTAYQMVSQTRNLDRLFLATHLLDMMYQLFIYCYQGHHLTEESAVVADHAYECPWYACSVRLQKMILIVMIRTRREVIITAGGFTTMSLGSFMAIIKASYSLFTLLEQVTE